MEEILASIRRIISDEGGSPAASQPAAAPEAPPRREPPPAAAAVKPAAPAPEARRPAPPPPPVEDDEPDVLELTEVVEPKPQEKFHRVEGNDVMFRDAEPPVREAPPVLAPRPPRPVVNEQLLSQQASTAVSSAFGSLAQTMFSGDSRTVDDLVREMLQPLLKAWLEDNLPSLVERLVRAEIERVSRGGR
jgi:cell pole-organizing protein PopZ